MLGLTNMSASLSEVGRRLDERDSFVMNVYTYLYRAYSEDFIYRDFTGKSMSSVLMIGYCGGAVGVACLTLGTSDVSEPSLHRVRGVE